MVFRDDDSRFSQVGALPGEAIENVARQATGLDIDQIRRDIETLRQSVSSVGDANEAPTG